MRLHVVGHEDENYHEEASKKYVIPQPPNLGPLRRRILNFYI